MSNPNQSCIKLELGLCYDNKCLLKNGLNKFK